MKKLLCNEIGFRECEWELMGDTDEELLRKAHEHVKRMHLTDVDDARLRSHIHEG